MVDHQAIPQAVHETVKIDTATEIAAMGAAVLPAVSPIRRGGAHYCRLCRWRRHRHQRPLCGAMAV